MIDEIKCKDKFKTDGYIYLATTDLYKIGNHYRLGRTSDLKKRIAGYKNGRTVADKPYYVFTYETEKVDLLETILRDLLKPFREDPSIDMYVIDFNILLHHITNVCDLFHKSIIPNINELIDKNTSLINSKNKNSRYEKCIELINRTYTPYFNE